MELKFKEVDSTYTVETKVNGGAIKIKPFLAIDEISQIVNSCLETENQIERHLLKMVMVARFCTNIELLNGDIDKEEYDLIASLGLESELDYEVTNFYVIDRLIDKCLFIIFSI